MDITSQTTVSNLNPPNHVLLKSSVFPGKMPSGVCVGILKPAGMELRSRTIASVDLSPSMVTSWTQDERAKERLSRALGRWETSMVYLDVDGHVGHERLQKTASRRGVWGIGGRTFVLGRPSCPPPHVNFPWSSRRDAFILSRSCAPASLALVESLRWPFASPAHCSLLSHEQIQHAQEYD